MFIRFFLLIVLTFFLPFEEIFAQQLGEYKARALNNNIVRVAGKQEGYGFIIGQDEKQIYIVTANHLISGSNGNERRPQTVPIELNTQRNETIQAKVLKGHYVDTDIAVISIARNSFSTEKGVDIFYLSNELNGFRGEKVWFYDYNWILKSNPCTITSNEPEIDNIIRIEDCSDIVSGHSGGPFISKNGIEGMILRNAAGNNAIALSMSYIRKAMKAWNYPIGNRINPQKIWTKEERTQALGKRKVLDIGETWKIPKNGTYYFGEMVLKANSKIVLDESVQEVSIIALEVEIDNNVRIEGIGEEGRLGEPGRDGSGNGDCHPGTSGLSGNSGKKGQDGKKINLKFGINSIGTLIVDASGGYGGRGGFGGVGGPGGKADCSSNCRGANGGTGGNGGDGGDGGKGGNINFEYFVLEDFSQSLTPEKDFILLSKGGRGGNGGKAGLGGNGGSSKDCGLFNKGGGGGGHAGSMGLRGNDGMRGEVNHKKMTIF